LGFHFFNFKPFISKISTSFATLKKVKFMTEKGTKGLQHDSMWDTKGNLDKTTITKLVQCASNVD
jgi:hypothetical protein